MATNYTNATVLTANGSIYGESDSDLNDIYEHLYGNMASYIVYYVVLVLSLTVVPLLCSTIVLYEHFGADSQKRTIINRISSLIFTNIAINSFIWAILRIMRDVYGLLPVTLVAWIFVFTKSIQTSTLLFASELTIFRFLYIVIWKRMKSINDEFWMRVLARSTYLMALYIRLVAFLTGMGLNELGEIIQVTHTSTR